MKRKNLSRLILVFIVGSLFTNVLEKRDDVECWVNPHADRHQLAYNQGFASDQEIRMVVWNDLLKEFNGQLWRVALDNAYHALFMGASRPDLVLKQLRHPIGEHWWIVTCEGGISWTVRDERDRWPPWYSADSRRSSGSAYDVTVALRRIPDEELQHYSVEATVYLDTRIYDDDGYTDIYEHHDAGEVSAEAWLAGQIVPEYWSKWHDRWQQRAEHLQSVDGEPVE